ncbi:anaerobic ribonucleoside triphosphate reductase [Paenibacillus donghaensis]|uniref:anaerobic ribonucleoside triphosphate reductase n=1 Tax=Paenibacillus donghaensis TaxID=414771 RepID=UPI001883F007|nr:anaerobic ribonucleoside triphosphate reductase [Paenibacillus donghaensis]MBE9913834.1 anaerobic ribonucleoside triphosphate reductase [Paenibacillus donghaensis]
MNVSKQDEISQLWSSFHEMIHAGNQELLQENANVDGKSPMGLMSKFGSESARLYTYENLLSPEVKEAIDQNILYPHDLDFYAAGTTTCCQIPLGKLLRGGFNTGHGHMREPQDIKSAMALASIILQANQNQQHGGQAFPMFDYDLAPYVRKTYEKKLQLLEELPLPENFDREQEAWKMTERDVFQACEAFVHNANSMHSRGGGQVPFISINYGTDTSAYGRMLTRQLLLATQRGLGNGETPIFPIQIFKVKSGVNFQPEDPNYDLYKLALETTARRMFPNFSFLDASFNKAYDRGTPESEVCYMGCRTRVMGNVNGEENAIGRGNLSFTSINLVKLALLSATPAEFDRRLMEAVDMAVKQLHERFRYQAGRKAGNYRFLYSQGVWRGGEFLRPHDQLGELLKQGTLSIGFIGLAESLTALYGEHHGQNPELQRRGLEIIRSMRERMDRETEGSGLNFTLIATPAEGLSGKFVKKDREQFGNIPGVTDRDYYTNSFHIPVYYPITAAQKIKLEAPYHELCNAGHITYVEVDGSVIHNTAALDRIVRCMAENGIGYGSINHPVDRCKSCGYSGIIAENCPACGAEDGHVERIRRITGYLVGDMDKWNPAKRAEEADRVKHGR